jgi:hypothetical protein
MRLSLEFGPWLLFEALRHPLGNLYSEVFDLKPTSGVLWLMRSIGVLEYWSIGVMEYWSVGVLECWKCWGVMGENFSVRLNIGRVGSVEEAFSKANGKFCSSLVTARSAERVSLQILTRAKAL